MLQADNASEKLKAKIENLEKEVASLQASLLACKTQVAGVSGPGSSLAQSCIQEVPHLLFTWRISFRSHFILSKHKNAENRKLFSLLLSRRISWERRSCQDCLLYKQNVSSVIDLVLLIRSFLRMIRSPQEVDAY